MKTKAMRCVNKTPPKKQRISIVLENKAKQKKNKTKDT